MKKFLLILISILTVPLSAQPFAWVNDAPITLSLNSDMVNYSVTADGSGNVYLCGFKDNQSPWSVDILGNLQLLKYGPDGNLIYEKIFNGKLAAFDMISDPAGNLYLALGYNQTFSYQDLNITQEMLQLKPILLKLDTAGNLLWHKEFPPMQSSPPNLQSLHLDSEGNLFVAFDNFINSVIRKYNPNGDELFDIAMDEVNMVSSVCTDTEGNVYAAGSCGSEFSTFQGVNAGTDFQYSTYVAKFSPTGEFRWVRYVEDITCPQPRVVAKGPDEIYFLSILWESVQIGDFVTEGPQLSFNTDFYLTRLNSEGIFQWVREVPGMGRAIPGSRNSLAVDDEGNVYMAGKTSLTINWTDEISTVGSGQDALILKYSSDGELIYALNPGGTLNDRCDGIVINSQGDVFVSGMINGNATFNPLMIEGSDLRPFVAKLNQGALSTADHHTNLTIWPNPASTTVFFPDGVQSAEIYNTLGQRIDSFKIENNTADVSQLASGIYLLVIDDKTPICLIKN